MKPDPDQPLPDPLNDFTVKNVQVPMFSLSKILVFSYFFYKNPPMLSSIIRRGFGIVMAIYWYFVSGIPECCLIVKINSTLIRLLGLSGSLYVLSTDSLIFKREC